MRSAAALFLVLGLAACGNRTDLAPPEGKSLPPAPYGREEPPATSHLLDPPTQAQPARNVELRKRSEDREDDPFDLPPSE